MSINDISPYPYTPFYSVNEEELGKLRSLNKPGYDFINQWRLYADLKAKGANVVIGDDGRIWSVPV